MTIAKVSKSQISKTVRDSSLIEGYKKPSKEVQVKAKVLMEKYNVKVSSKR
ncbi:hypothetical protein [Malaciobacter canalis]|uniref:hypothetical protein n=1 Tax=Malaciobacter canalis TaxID=1912871 RepID=UPI0013FDAAE3|nr:hypothetical protein [Malaciobacter canalis]QEE32546.1 hypothetical protein ACAN_1057 [Malaciobacter canalis]